MRHIPVGNAKYANGTAARKRIMLAFVDILIIEIGRPDNNIPAIRKNLVVDLCDLPEP
jgi:hypothetical protein